MSPTTIARILIPVLLLQLAVPLELLAAPRQPPPERPQHFTWEAPNGFHIEVDARPARDGRLDARAVLRSRSGEAMTFEFAPGLEAGPMVVIDGELLLSYRLSPRGRVRSVRLHDGSEWTIARGTAPGSAQKTALYGQLVTHLAAGHSPEFIDEMSAAMRVLEQETAFPAQVRSIIACVLGIAGYILSIWGLIAGCSVAGVVTIGASCLLAIISHEVAAASAIVSCLPD